MERDCDTSSHTLSHSVTRDTVTHNVTHDTDLWDSDHHVTSLSGCDIHLKADAKVLATSLKCLACFIQKRPLKGRPIEQFQSPPMYNKWGIFGAVLDKKSTAV